MPERIQKVVEKAAEMISNNATAVTYTSGGITAGFSLASLQSYAWVITLVLCALTFIMNLYFKQKNDKRQEEQHKLNQAKFLMDLDKKTDGPITREYIESVFKDGIK